MILPSHTKGRSLAAGLTSFSTTTTCSTRNASARSVKLSIAAPSLSCVVPCRPQAAAPLAELKNTGRGADAVVIGEPHRAFCGNQYGITFRFPATWYDVAIVFPSVTGDS
jgi:hypothetical protein